jgi:hypothetical protein
VSCQLVKLPKKLPKAGRVPVVRSADCFESANILYQSGHQFWFVFRTVHYSNSPSENLKPQFWIDTVKHQFPRPTPIRFPVVFVGAVRHLLTLLLLLCRRRLIISVHTSEAQGLFKYLDVENVWSICGRGQFDT